MRVKEMIQRVRMVYPDASEKYIMTLINDCLDELAAYQTYEDRVKIDVAQDQRWYGIGSINSNITVDKIYAVYIMDDDSNYRLVPRIVNSRMLVNEDEK